jgi:hypothetical protein
VTSAKAMPAAPIPRCLMVCLLSVSADCVTEHAG